MIVEIVVMRAPSAALKEYGSEATGKSVTKSQCMALRNMALEWEKFWNKSLVEEALCEPCIQIDPPTLASLLRWCGHTKDLFLGTCTHDYIKKSGLEKNMFLGNLLVQMYSKCGALKDARNCFGKLHQRDLYSWNFMIRAYAHHGQGKEVFNLFEQMNVEGIMSDDKTLICILSACAMLSDVAEGARLHARIVSRKFDSDTSVMTALVYMYGKCGSIKDAERLFEKAPEHDACLRSAIIATYAQNGLRKHALRHFNEMQHDEGLPDQTALVNILSLYKSEVDLAEGKQMHAQIIDSGFELDIAVGTALVNMYGKCGSPDDARRIFDKMPAHDIVCWTGMITAYSQNGQGKDALAIFDKMQQEGVLPNRITFVSILSACASQAILAQGKHMHAYLASIGFESDVSVGNALMNMYGKCGSLSDALRMFNRMPERDVISWNAMIGAYVQNGHSKGALQLFFQMQERRFRPDKATFVSILSACSCQASLEWVHECIVRTGLDLDTDVRNALINMYGNCYKKCRDKVVR